MSGAVQFSPPLYATVLYGAVAHAQLASGSDQLATRLLDRLVSNSQAFGRGLPLLDAVFV
eukprot:COSAG06_NODE_42661_length_379_cov_1.425000_2_plen_59_part_01